jgi:hypothetical protein
MALATIRTIERSIRSHENMLAVMRAAGPDFFVNFDASHFPTMRHLVRGTIAHLDTTIATLGGKLATLASETAQAEALVEEQRDGLDAMRTNYDAHALPLYAALAAFRTGKRGPVEVPYPLPLERNGLVTVQQEAELYVWDGAEYVEEDGWYPALMVHLGDEVNGASTPLWKLRAELEQMEADIDRLKAGVDSVRRSMGRWRAGIAWGKSNLELFRRQRCLSVQLVEVVEQCMAAVREGRAALAAGEGGKEKGKGEAASTLC